jgi:hypothetical protein
MEKEHQHRLLGLEQRLQPSVIQDAGDPLKLGVQVALISSVGHRSLAQSPQKLLDRKCRVFPVHEIARSRGLHPIE